MKLGKDTAASGQSRGLAECEEAEAEQRVPLSVRKAREARKRRDDAWRYVWMNFASMMILMVTLAIVCYRMGAQNCR
jgi:hypothetical protein